MVNTPTVTFANAVTQVGMPQANLTAQLLGLGGATADSYNRLSINAPAMLFNNAGAGIEATVNKAAPANDAAFAFKTGFSARALIGLLGSDNFGFKVSADGSAFFEAITIDRSNGQVELPQPTILPGLAAAPAPPPTGKIAVYARTSGDGPFDQQRGGLAMWGADHPSSSPPQIAPSFFLSTRSAAVSAKARSLRASSRSRSLTRFLSSRVA